MGLGMFSFMFPDVAQHPQAWAIQARTLSFPMKGAKPIGENWSLLSERTETKPASLTSLCQTRQAGSHLRGCHV